MRDKLKGKVDPSSKDSDSNGLVDRVASSRKVPDLDRISEHLSDEDVELFSDKLRDAARGEESKSRPKIRIEQQRISDEIPLKKD